MMNQRKRPLQVTLTKCGKSASRTLTVALKQAKSRSERKIRNNGRAQSYTAGNRGDEPPVCRTRNLCSCRQENRAKRLNGRTVHSVKRHTEDCKAYFQGSCESVRRNIM